MPSAKLSDRMIERAAHRFRALSEPQRLRILRALEDGPHSVGEVVAKLNGNQPNISRHLQALTLAGLTARRRDGNSIYYSIADPVVIELCALVCRNAEKEAEQELKALRAGRNK